jgi:hypothetical protein
MPLIVTRKKGVDNMFGINQLKLDVSRLWNAVTEADKTARCAVKDNDVISKSNKEAHKLIEEQGRAIMAIANYLEVTFEHKRVPDPIHMPQEIRTIEIMVCKPRPTTPNPSKAEVIGAERIYFSGRRKIAEEFNKWANINSASLGAESVLAWCTSVGILDIGKAREFIDNIKDTK